MASCCRCTFRTDNSSLACLAPRLHLTTPLLIPKIQVKCHLLQEGGLASTLRLDLSDIPKLPQDCVTHGYQCPHISATLITLWGTR